LSPPPKSKKLLRRADHWREGGFAKSDGIANVLDPEPPGDSQEILWNYFERVRAGGVALPAMIPTDKQVFMEATRDLPRMAKLQCERLAGKKQ